SAVSCVHSPAATCAYTRSLHDALPISHSGAARGRRRALGENGAVTDLSGLWDRMKKALGLGGPPGGGAAADAGAARGTAVGPSRGVAKSSPRGRTEGALPARPEGSPPGRPGDMVQAF